LLLTFQKELLLTRIENQIIKIQAITTQSTLSMKAKTKSKPISLLNANENVLSNQQANEKHQALNSQPITSSQPIRHTQLLKLEIMNLPIRVKKRKSSYKGQEKP
jgi:hypothetical protein